MQRSKNIRRPHKMQFQQSSVCPGTATLICISRFSYAAKCTSGAPHLSLLKQEVVPAPDSVTAFWCSVHGFGPSICMSWNLGR